MVDRTKPYGEVVKEQQLEHGKRVEARQRDQYDYYYRRNGLAPPLRALRPNPGIED